MLGKVAKCDEMWMFVECEHLQVGIVPACLAYAKNVLILFPLQLSAIAKEAAKLDVKIAPLAVVTDSFASAPGFIPGAPGAPLLPVINNHQTAFLGVGSALTNVTNTAVALKSDDNGSVVMRAPLLALERITTPANHLFRPGQKPVPFVSRMRPAFLLLHILPASDFAVAVRIFFAQLRRAHPTST